MSQWNWNELDPFKHNCLWKNPAYIHRVLSMELPTHITIVTKIYMQTLVRSVGMLIYLSFGSFSVCSNLDAYRRQLSVTIVDCWLLILKPNGSNFDFSSKHYLTKGCKFSITGCDTQKLLKGIPYNTCYRIFVRKP